MTGAADIAPTTPDKLCSACDKDAHVSSSEVPPAADEAQRRIKELEAQVQSLTDGASRTAEKASYYESELSNLRAQQAQAQAQAQASHKASSSSTKNNNKTSISSSISSSSPPSSPTSPNSNSNSHGHHQSRLSAFASLLHSHRRSVAAGPNPNSNPNTHPSNSNSSTTSSRPSSSSHSNSHSHSHHRRPSTAELQNALHREQSLRKAAETQLAQVNTELEELTVQLFSEANEMVSRERRARAKLEERVKVVEQRDLEKKGRLERLERAFERVERVRGLVG